MSLDHSLPTLLIAPKPGEPNWIDFTRKEQNGRVDYSAVKEEDKLYLIDPLSQALHATIVVVAPKIRLVSLESPPLPIEIKSTSMLTWEWSFMYEEQKYSWRREAIGIGSSKSYTLYWNGGKGDTDFSVVRYNPRAGKGLALHGGNAGGVQILNYNMQRLDPAIKDQKGFEICVLLSLVSFLDHLFHHSPSGSLDVNGGLDPLTQAHLNGTPSVKDKGKGKEVEAPVPPPGRKEEKKVVPKVLDPNEIEVIEARLMGEYTARSLKLLEDKNLLYITLLSANPHLGAPTLAMAEDVKRRHYKATGEELKTFAREVEGDADSRPKPPLPPPNLKSSGGKQYVPPPPPAALKIYISRIHLDLPTKASSRPTPKVPKPILRPPINFDEPPPIPPAPLRMPMPQGQTRPGPPAGHGAGPGQGQGGKLQKPPGATGAGKGKEKEKEEERKSWFGGRR